MKITKYCRNMENIGLVQVTYFQLKAGESQRIHFVPFFHPAGVNVQPAFPQLRSCKKPHKTQGNSCKRK